MDLSLITNEGRLNLRVAGVIIDNGSILVEQGLNIPFCVCPGGRIQFDETAEDAIKREIFEELGVQAKIIRPLYVHQNFFNADGMRFHELCFFFLLETGLTSRESSVLEGKDNSSVYKWISFGELQNTAFYPVFLKKTLRNLPQTVQIVTEIENKEIK